MRIFLKHSITLVELLVAVSLIGLLIVGISSLDTYARLHLVTSDRSAQVQNETSYVLEHIAKQITKAIGNRAIPGEDPVDFADISGDTAVKVYIDVAPGGVLPGDGLRGTPGDRWIAYRSRLNTGGASTKYEFWYCYECSDSSCTTCSSGWETIATKVNIFDRSAADNTIYINIASCFDPQQTSYNCGSLDNPQYSMKTQIKMPAVSIH